MSTSIPAEDITAFLGMEPDRIWKMDKLRFPDSCIREAEHGWELTTGSQEGFDFLPHVLELMHRIEPVIPQLIGLRQKGVLDIQVSCTGYFEETVPSIVFPPSLLATLAHIGASLDVDLIQSRKS